LIRLDQLLELILGIHGAVSVKEPVEIDLISGEGFQELRIGIALVQLVPGEGSTGDAVLIGKLVILESHRLDHQAKALSDSRFIHRKLHTETLPLTISLWLQDWFLMPFCCRVVWSQY